MKKKLFFALTAILVTLAGSYLYQRQNSNPQLSDIALANIEALAIGEFTPNGWTCFWRYSDDLSNDNFLPIIRCDDCHTVTATIAYASGYCWH